MLTRASQLDCKQKNKEYCHYFIIQNHSIRDGRLRKGDEVLMVNHRSVAGLNKNGVLQLIRSSTTDLHLLVARVRHHCSHALIIIINNALIIVIMVGKFFGLWFSIFTIRKCK